MKVAITDYTFPSLDTEEQLLAAAGHEIVSGQCKTSEELIALVADADVVITQFASINADVVNAMRNAKAIVRYGIGYDNVDCDAAREKNIPVCNIPEFCIDEVADHAVAFILAMTRQLRANCAHIVSGEWGLCVPLEQMRVLKEQTVGIIGLGRIGKAVADRLKPFQAKLLTFDPGISESDAKTHGCSLVSIHELLAESDIVTLHCPSTEKTRHIISHESLATMKSGAILINVGRGDLVELKALTEALESGHISAAALDVFEEEPLSPESPLLKMNNVIVSSHVASASPTAVHTLRETAAKLALAALNGEHLATVVNGVKT